MPKCAIKACRRKAFKGKTTCWVCLPRHNRWNRERRNRRMRSGCCADCGRERDTISNKFCSLCLKESWSDKVRRGWIEAALCAGCGYARESKHSKYCVRCNEAREFTA